MNAQLKILLLLISHFKKTKKKNRILQVAASEVPNEINDHLYNKHQ
jgi:hypothetical protein